MKRERIVPIIIVAVVVVAVAAAGIYFATNPTVWQQTLVDMELTKVEEDGLTASGFIEAEEVDIASELGGRVIELFAEEGEDVEAEQLLVQMDDSLLEAQIEAARAAVKVAQAQLAQAEAGARPEQIRQAEATLMQAQAARDGAYQAWLDTIAIRDNPQELDARIAQARADVEVTEAVVTQANAQKDAAEIAHNNYWNAKEALADAKEELKDIPPEYRPDLPGFQLDFHLIPNNYWKAWVGVNSAGAAHEGAQIALNNLYAMREDTQELNAQVDATKTQYQAARAIVGQAEAQLEALKAGATAEEIATLEAQVGQAQAALDTLLKQRDKLSITAPVGGLVLGRSIHEGELAAPGGTMLTLGDLDKVTLTVYVPEDQLGKVNVGQDVEVKVDSFPGRTFTGKVVAIAQEAEFTPRNVQTKEERVNMVFAVDVRIPNSDHALKPGVPADALIITEEE